MFSLKTSIMVASLGLVFSFKERDYWNKANVKKKKYSKALTVVKRGGHCDTTRTVDMAQGFELLRQ